MAVLTSNYPASLDTASTLGEVSNRAKTTLAVTLASTGETQISLSDASGFPNSGAVTIDNEIFYYNGKTGNVLTIEARARQGTAAAGHSSGALVYLRLTKGHWEVLRTAVINLETKLGAGTLTQGSVLFADSTNTVAQDNSNLFYDSTNKVLRLVDKNYTSPVGSGLIDLSLGSTSTKNIGTNSYVSLAIDRSLRASGTVSQVIGQYTYVNLDAQTSSNYNATAVMGAEVILGTGGGFTTPVSGITDSWGLYAWHDIGVPTSHEAIGLEGDAIVGSAGPGQGGGTPTVIGIRGLTSIGYISLPLGIAGDFALQTGGGVGATVANSIAVRARVNNRASIHTLTVAKGLALENWANSGTIGTSYGIYADTSIDLGTTKYFIYSLSTSPSVFTGTVQVPDDAYNATTWDGNFTVPTKNAVRDKIEAITLGGGGVDLTSDQSIAGIKTFTSSSGIGARGVFSPNAASTSDAFQFSITSGSGGATSGSGAPIIVTAGSALGTGGEGGYIDVIAGNAKGNGNGGTITLYAGFASSAGTGSAGDIILRAGKTFDGVSNNQGLIKFQEYNTTASVFRSVAWKFNANTNGLITLTLPDANGTVALTSDIGIGKTVASSTQGSVLFAGASGVLAQNNNDFFWDDTNKRLALQSQWSRIDYMGAKRVNLLIQPDDSQYGFTYNAGVNDWSMIFMEADQASNSNSITTRLIEGYVTLNGTGTGQRIVAFDGSAISLAGVGATVAEITGINFIAATQSARGGTLVQGINVIAGTRSSGGTVGTAYGIKSTIQSINGTTITLGSIFKGTVNGTATGTLTEIRGLDLSGWFTSLSVTTSYGIYMDTSIDRGATNKYAIYSLSTSPSLLSGTLTLSTITATSILYAGTGGLISATPSRFAFASAEGNQGMMLLGDTSLRFNTGIDISRSLLQIADTTAYTGDLGRSYFGAFVSINRGGNNDFYQTSGIRTRTVYSGSSIGYPVVTGSENFVSNAGSSGGTISLQGIEGIVTAAENCNNVQGVWVNPILASGKTASEAVYGLWSSTYVSGTTPFTYGMYAILSLDTGGTLGTAYGARIDATAAGTKAITNFYMFSGIYRHSNTATVTNIRGLDLSGWDSAGVTNSYGIYADSSIDVGGTLKYFIYSLSTSPSLFTGTVTVPDDAYNASSWDGNFTVPTKNAVRDKIESMSGAAVSTTINSATPYNGTTTTGLKVVLHNTSGGAITHNLPTAVGNTALISIKKTDSSVNTVTIDANSTETIDGGLTAVLTRQYESVTLASDGTNWFIV